MTIGKATVGGARRRHLGHGDGTEGKATVRWGKVTVGGARRRYSKGGRLTGGRVTHSSSRPHHQMERMESIMRTKLGIFTSWLIS